MDVNDYLIDQSRKDWSELLSGWSDMLPASFELWMVNRFGDLFFVVDDGSVNMLDVGTGNLRRLADTRDHFCSEMDVDDNASDWLMIGMVDACVAAGLTLTANQCYSFKIPPILGGKYAVENFESTDLSVHYSFLADIYSQTKDLPDGTKVSLVVKQKDT